MADKDLTLGAQGSPGADGTDGRGRRSASRRIVTICVSVKRLFFTAHPPDPSGPIVPQNSP